MLHHNLTMLTKKCSRRKKRAANFGVQFFLPVLRHPMNLKSIHEQFKIDQTDGTWAVQTVMGSVVAVILGLTAFIFLSAPQLTFAVEGKEFTPQFRDPTLPAFDVAAPQSYIRQRTDELFRLLEESPEKRARDLPWFGAIKLAYGGIGHNHFQGFITGKYNRNHGVALLDLENEYDFGLRERRSGLFSTSHHVSPQFYLQTLANFQWQRRPMPDAEDLDIYPPVDTRGTRQTFTFYVREMKPTRLTHTWIDFNHTSYDDGIYDDDWQNWQIGFSRAYQFFLLRNQPAYLNFRFSGDRLEGPENSQLRTWNGIDFSFNTAGPSETSMRVGLQLAAYSRYDNTFQLWLGPTFELYKEFSDRIQGEASFRSVQSQPTFHRLFYNKGVGTMTFQGEDVEDGEVSEPVWLRQQVNFLLSADERITIYAEQKYRSQFFYWEDTNQDETPELFFTSNDVFVFLSGFEIETQLSPRLNQHLNFEVEKQFHGDNIFPNVGDLYFRGSYLVTYRDMTHLQLFLDYTNDFYTDREGRVELPGCFRIDLQFTQYISKNFTVLVEGINITDTKCYNSYGLNERNRRYRLGVNILY